MANIYQLNTKYNNLYPDLVLDRLMAEEYLRALSRTGNGKAFNKHRFVFGVFPDDKTIPKEDKKQLTRQLIGTWDEHREELEYHNRSGCGIFVAVNNTDGYGRRNHNITSVNTIFVEDDEGLKQQFPLIPSITVETSPGKFHYYFLTDTKDKLKARAVQEHMVTQYNSDPNAKDLSRVLRIPGFTHLKSDQYKVKLLNCSAEVFTWNTIISNFPPAKIAPHCAQTYSINLNEREPDTINILTALSVMDPECIGEREVWLNTIMALHHEYKGADAGRKLALEWSKGEYYQTNNKYENTQPSTFVDEDDFNYTWNSFSFNTNNTAPITIGTLFKYAEAKGFQHDFEPPPFVISKLPENADSTLKKISRYYAIIRTNGGDVKIVYRNTESGHYNFTSKQSFELDIANLKVPVVKHDRQGAPRIEHMPAAPLWIQDDATQHYKNDYFLPKSKWYCSNNKTLMPEVLPDHKGLNRFFGFYIEPNEGPINTLNKIKDLVLNIICDGQADQAEHLHKWIAFTRRYPEKKTGLMITLMGEKGTGKTVMASLILALHAPFTYVTSNFKSLTGQFNSHFAHTTMIGLEEATWGGREQDNSILKDLITQDTMVVNTKYLSVTNESKSCFDIIATANPGFSVPEETRGEERRFWTLSVSNKHKKDKIYFDQFGRPGSDERKELLETYAYYLDSLDLNNYDPQDIPSYVGEHSRYNQIESGGDALHFLLSLCENEEVIPVDETNLATMNLYSISVNNMWNNENDKISTKLLIPVKFFKQAYIETAKFERTSTISAIHIAKSMDKFFIQPHKKKVKPSKTLYTKYHHLTKDGRYLEIPNRKHCIEHLKNMQLWV